MSVEVELEARIVRSQSHRTVEFGDAGPTRPLPYCSIVGKERQLSAFEFGTRRVVFTRAKSVAGGVAWAGGQQTNTKTAPAMKVFR
jgi:hypothetical protein